MDAKKLRNGSRAFKKYDYLAMDTPSLKEDIQRHLVYSVGKDPLNATERDWFFTTAYVVRDRLIERWMETMRNYYYTDAKRIYYLSLEFLIGRSLSSSLINLGIFDDCLNALEEVGIDYSCIEEIEPDAALGNGGLGRLAACFLDSMATMRLPGYGYGIRYDYGMFYQRIEHGSQVEHPDNWLRYGNPWEFPRPEILYPVKFFGKVVQYSDEFGRLNTHWIDTEDIMAMGYDVPVPGYATNTVNNLRLWSAKASRDFDLAYFNEGNYIKAVEDKNESENLSKVLYPDDTTEMGRELRLKQQYFFVSASLQEILDRHQKHHDNFDTLADKVAIQLNDTHPSIAIAELMRLLLDIHGLPWDKAWALCTQVFAYTNHTLMPEALETWPVALFERMLPRHLQIIYEINFRFLKEVSHCFPGDCDRLRRMSIINEDGGRRVRMAYLAIVGSHRVNGVAALHTELMKSTIFCDFYDIYPGKFVSITNGVTPRRWILQANRDLGRLISQHIGGSWVLKLERLKKLEPLADDPAFRKEFRRIKLANKERLAAYIKTQVGVDVDPHSLFDVQVKRIHEYKRQILNVLHVITRYNRIRANPDANWQARTVIIGGKAAPGYFMAKLSIRLVADVADVVNNDPAMRGRLKLVFLPNYDVSSASIIMPAAELSEQISTAGTEASGTGNMKLAMNGALTIGTLDGANIEIADAVGRENVFIFGHTAAEIQRLQANQDDPWHYYHENGELRQVVDMLRGGYFNMEEPERYHPIADALTTHGDRYFLMADYGSYIATQDQVDTLYQSPEDWTRKAVLNVARMGHFSSDRAIEQYADEIWDVKPTPHD